MSIKDLNDKFWIIFDEFVNDSEVLLVMRDDSELSEVYESLPKNFDLELVYKMYVGSYDFDADEMLHLIKILNFVNNKYLEDILVLCKFMKFEISEYFDDNLLLMYNEINGTYKELIDRQSISILKWLKEKGLFLINSESFTYACSFASRKMLEWMYDFGTIDINNKFYFRETDTLYIKSAVFHNNHEAVKFLIENGLEITNNMKLLIHSAKNTNPTIVSYILNIFKFKNEEFENSLIMSASRGNLDFLKFMLNYVFENGIIVPNIYSNIISYLLDILIDDKYYDIYEYLLSLDVIIYWGQREQHMEKLISNSDINEYQRIINILRKIKTPSINYPLQKSLDLHNVLFFEFFLENGANPNNLTFKDIYDRMYFEIYLYYGGRVDFYILLSRIRFDDFENFTFLFENFTFPNLKHDQNNLLINAIEIYTDIYSIKNSFTINLDGEFDSMTSRINIIKYLLNNVNYDDQVKINAIKIGIEKYNIEIVNLLLEHQTNPYASIETVILQYLHNKNPDIEKIKELITTILNYSTDNTQIQKSIQLLSKKTYSNKKYISNIIQLLKNHILTF